MREPSPTELELQYTQRLLACLVYEVQVNIVEAEEPPGDIFQRLEALIDHVPSAVKPLVEYLRRNPPQQRKGELYTYSFPFVEWRSDG